MLQIEEEDKEEWKEKKKIKSSVSARSPLGSRSIFLLSAAMSLLLASRAARLVCKPVAPTLLRRPAAVVVTQAAVALPPSITRSLHTPAARRSAPGAASPTPAAPATPAASSSFSASSSSTDARSLFPGLVFDHLSVSLDASLGALTVTMSRPALHNAFNELLIAEMRALFDAIAAGVKDTGAQGGAGPIASLRAVVLTGSGASFSAGADLHWMAKMRTYTEAENLADARLLFQMIHSISSCPVPTIARVNGAALGGGVGLVAACDLAYATSAAQFGLTEVRLGLSPAVISSFVMNKLTPAATNQYFLTGARFGADEARRVGLVNTVVNDEAELDAAVRKTLEEMALNSPKAGTTLTQHSHTAMQQTRAWVWPLTLLSLFFAICSHLLLASLPFSLLVCAL